MFNRLKTKICLVLIFSATMLFNSCTKDIGALPEDEQPPQPPTTPPPPVNLIQNSSFELSGQPTLQGWYRPNGVWLQADTFPPYIAYVADTPVGGDNWSLELTGNWIVFQQPTDYFTFVTGQNGTYIYELTAWAKCLFPWNIPPYYNQNGSQIAIGINIAPLTVVSQPNGYMKYEPLDTVSIWKKYTLIDTLTTVATDTIAIKIQAFGQGPSGTETYLFDKIELVKRNL